MEKEYAHEALSTSGFLSKSNMKATPKLAQGDIVGRNTNSNCPRLISLALYVYWFLYSMSELYESMW